MDLTKGMMSKTKKPKNTVPVAPTDERRREHTGKRIDLAKAWKLRVVNRLSYGEIADTLGCSKSTVHAALEKLSTMLPDPELVNAYEQVETYLLTAAKAKLLASLTDEQAIEKASLNNRAFAFSQVSMQERLSKGKSTENKSVMHTIFSAAFEQIGREGMVLGMGETSEESEVIDHADDLIFIEQSMKPSLEMNGGEPEPDSFSISGNSQAETIKTPQPVGRETVDPHA